MPLQTRSQSSIERSQTPVDPPPVIPATLQDGPQAGKGKRRHLGLSIECESAQKVRDANPRLKIPFFHPLRPKSPPRHKCVLAKEGKAQPAVVSSLEQRGAAASTFPEQSHGSSSDRNGSESETRSRITLSTPSTPTRQTQNAGPALAELLPEPEGRFPRLPSILARTLSQFLLWVTIHLPPTTETETTIYWLDILSFFITGQDFYNGSSMDLNQKALQTIRKSDQTFSRRAPAGNEDRFEVKGHNRPDWVLLYRAIERVSRSLQARVCMVFEAKPSRAWGTALRQIVVYMMKARIADGCGMGMVVAGTEYRFFYWEGMKLYMAVRPDWAGARSYTWKSLIDLTDQAEWNLYQPGWLGPIARRNVFHIFTHLKQQVNDITQAQERGSPLLALNGPPPDLQHTIRVEITSVWNNYPGSEYPPTNGVAIESIAEVDEGGGDGNGHHEGAAVQDRPDAADQGAAADQGQQGAADQSQRGAADQQNYQDEFPDLPDGLSASDLAVIREFSEFARVHQQQELKSKIQTWVRDSPSPIQTLSSDSSDEVPLTPAVSRVMLPGATTGKLLPEGWGRGHDDDKNTRLGVYRQM